jgi:ribonuclease III
MAVDRALEPAFQAGPLSKTVSSGENLADLAVLQDRLGYRFHDPALLARALTHVGATTKRVETYQRLEFLGDRVLGLSIASMLYDIFPTAEEGELSRRLADLVRRETCAEVSQAWQVEPHIRLAAGEKASVSLKQAILGDICESIIGAVYLDGGMDMAADLVARAFEPRLRNPERPLRDAKTTLQEWAQARGLAPPVYREKDRSGPDHAPEFTVVVSVEGYAPVEAQGSSKRIAEQNAAGAFARREQVSLSSRRRP